MKSSIVRIMCQMFCGVTFVFASCGHNGGEATPLVETKSAEAAIDTAAFLYDNISNCARLATAEYKVHKIVTFDDRIVVRGKLFSQSFSKEIPVGDRKIAIPIDVTLRGYVDFANFNEKNIKRRGKKITIILPDPDITVSASKVDHKGVKKIVDPLRSNFKQKEIEAYTKQGVDSIVAAIPGLGIVEAARKNAVSVLVPIIKQMGYAENDITIEFRPAVSDRTILHWADIEHLLNK